MPNPLRSPRLPRPLRRLARPALLGLGGLEPVSERWGYDRGQPIDRYYIERFLRAHRSDVRGRVLEVKDDTYTRRFGTGVEQSDVLDVDPGNERATIVADLAAADEVRSELFDCLLVTQTLQYVFDLRAALRHCVRILRPGGVLLASAPAMSRVACELPSTPDYWRLTPASCRALAVEAFGPENVEVTGYGNVLAARAFLAGLASDELSASELDRYDERFPVIVAVRAVAPSSGGDAS